MTAIRILLHYTPAGVLEALGKVKEEEGRMFMVCYGYACEKLSSPCSDGHAHDLGLAEEQHGRDSGTFKVMTTLTRGERNTTS